MTFHDNRIDVLPDGIRFEKIEPSDLEGIEFGLRLRSRALPRVTCAGAPIGHTFTELTDGLFTLRFSGDGKRAR